jgi:multidrug efflux pump subunit AcrB
MNRFFNYFIQDPLIGKVITGSLLLLGIYGFNTVPINIWPSVAFDELVINTYHPGYSAKDIELRITNKIEDKLATISGIQYYESSSSEGRSMIKVVLEEKLKNPKEVKDKLYRAVDNAELPTELENRPSIQDINSDEIPVYTLGIIGGTTYADQFYYAKHLKDQLESLPGISQAVAVGYFEEEAQVLLDLEAMRTYQLSMHDIEAAFKRRHIRVSSGPIERPDTQQVVLNAEFANTSALNNLIIRSNFNQKTVYLRDVATVRMDFEKPISYTHINGQPGILLDIIKKESAEILPTVKALQAFLDQQILPNNLSIVLVNDMSYFLTRRLSVLVSNGLIGMAFVFVVLSIFLRANIAVWVAAGLPVAVSGILFLLPIAGQSINVVSLIGIILVIGIIVDDGIIVADSVVQQLEAGHDKKTAALLGIQTVFAPVITTLITTFLAFLPMLFMSGIMGKFVFCIPLVISFALLFSLVELSTALPTHLANTSDRFKKPILSMDRARMAYQRALHACLNRYKLMSVVFLISILGLGILSIRYITFELFPKASAESFIVNIKYPKGTSLKNNRDQVRAVESVLATMPKHEWISFKTFVGMTNTNSYDFANKENETEITVFLTPIAQRTRSAEAIIQDLKPQVPDTVFFRVESGGPPVGRAISVEIIHPNTSIRTDITNYVYQLLANTPGVRDLSRTDDGLRKTIQITPNIAKAAQLGVSLATIAQTINMAYTGQIIGEFNQNNDTIPIRLQLAPNDQTISGIQALVVPNAMGKLIPLAQLVSVDNGPITPSYYHYNGDPKTSIYGEINESETTIQSVVKRVENQIDTTQWPGAQVLFTGQNEDTNRSMNDLFNVFLLTLVGMFILLIVLLRSIPQTLLVLTCIPFGLLSASLAFIAHGQVLSFIGVIGMIGLSGVVVNDALVMMHHLNKTKPSGLPLSETIAHVASGCATRFRPVLLTSMTTVFGLLPLAYGFAGNDPYLAPMALAMGWGLLVATPLILFVFPCWYMVVCGRR